MRAFGYERNSEAEMPYSLSETTLLCTKEELEKIIDFLTKVHSDITEMKNVDGCHWHFRDYDPSWTKEQSDMIICSRGSTQ